LCCIFQETITNFETDLFKPVIDALQAESEKKYDENAYFTKNAEQQEINRNYRVIVDHLRANVFAIADGAVPGNKERGSILRRLIRRTIICAKNVSLKNNFVKIAVEKIIDVMKDFYPYLVNQQSMILEVIEKEKKQFETTLEKGLKLFYLEIAKAERVLNTEATFKLVDTYGFPIELITEIAEEKGIHVDLEGFNALLEEHRKNSRANLEVKAMSTQASDLIQFTTPTEFIYNTLKLDSSQIVKIFNEKFEAVSKINSIAWLALDKTVFYATSGGQIHDRGIIQIGENKFEVEDAIKAPNGQTLVCVDLDNI
jgi:alanyl-tRNA synthetase